MSLSRPLRPTLLSSSSSSFPKPPNPTPTNRTTPHHHPPLPSHTLQQIRHATLIRRPHRPYTFTQLVTLSDGSTYTQRTTSPAPVYRSTKDTRNTPMWNPSSQKLLTMEADEAGKLRRFREKFGRGWDAASSAQSGGKGKEEEGAVGVDGSEVGEGPGQEEVEDNLMDLIGGYGREAEGEPKATGAREGKAKSGKGKGGQN